MNDKVVCYGSAIPPKQVIEKRTFSDPNLMTEKQLEELTVEETQKILIEDPPGGLD